MSILPDMMLSSDLKVDPFYLNDIPELKPDSAEVAYYHAIMNRIPEPDRTAIKEIYSERGKLIQRLKPTSKELLKYKYQWYMQDYLASVASVDENIGRVLDHLKKTGTDKNTMIVYTSDQDFFLGENGWFDKRFMYDVSMHTPLIIKWPGVIEPGTTSNEMVQNIDFAPTLLDVAFLKTPHWMHGKSIKPLLINAKAKIARPYLYYHFYEYNADHTVLPHLGIRGDQHKLIYFYTVNEWELYDLKSDPHEQNNLVNSQKHLTTVNRLKKELIKARKKYDDREPAGVLK